MVREEGKKEERNKRKEGRKEGGEKEEKEGRKRISQSKVLLSYINAARSSRHPHRREKEKAELLYIVSTPLSKSPPRKSRDAVAK